MKLSIWFDDREKSPHEAYVLSKVSTRLRRHAHRLLSGRLRLRHEDTANGKIAHCSLDLKSHNHGTIHIDESGDNDFAAITKALRVAELKLKRTAERRKDTGRRRGRSGKQQLRAAELMGLATL